jgi:type I restriction enzyme S subunit
MALTINQPDKLHYEYLYYLLRFKGLSQVADTTSIPQINNKHIKPILFHTPSLKEKQAIAQILSDMDNDLNGLENRLAKTKAIKQGMMQELLTGKTRLV